MKKRAEAEREEKERSEIGGEEEEKSESFVADFFKQLFFYFDFGFVLRSHSRKKKKLFLLVFISTAKRPWDAENRPFFFLLAVVVDVVLLLLVGVWFQKKKEFSLSLSTRKGKAWRVRWVFSLSQFFFLSQLVFFNSRFCSLSFTPQSTPRAASGPWKRSRPGEGRRQSPR